MQENDLFYLKHSYICFSEKDRLFSKNKYSSTTRTHKNNVMKQYNRIMLGEHGRFAKDCLENNYIGAGFLKTTDLSAASHADENAWRKKMISNYLKTNPGKSIVTARTSIGFLWTICYGLKIGDIILTPNREGGYYVAEITGDYYYAPGKDLPHRRQVKWLDIVVLRKQMSQKLQNSTGSIGTCCNITKYTEELERLIAGEVLPTSLTAIQLSKETYKERSLHRLLANFLSGMNIHSKTIFHEHSSRKDLAQKWVHPDMVGVEYNEFRNSGTRSLLKATETKEYISLYSYELKRSIENDHQLKEYFFQALSNSSWANYGYLAALEISESVMEEMERLNRAFGIGIIELSPYSDNNRILFPARKNELDYYTIDKLCRMNNLFENFIIKATKVLNATTEVLEDVKGGLQKFCDKGFSSQEEILNYCKENHIPC